MSVRAINWAKSLFETADVPPQERLVLLILAMHHQDRTGECFPSYETIALLSGYDRRHAMRLVKRLEASGLVTIEKRRIKGHQGSNQFRLFGRIKRPSRVTQATLWQGDKPVTLPRVTPESPDREEIPYGERKGPSGARRIAENVSADGDRPAPSIPLRMIPGGRP